MSALLGVLFLLPTERPFAAVQSASTVATAVVTSGASDPDILDNFDDATDVNYWDGVMGLMEEFEANHSISRSFDTAGAYAGWSLNLTYNLNTSSNWNGYFLRLNSGTNTKNISAYKQLSFWVRGAVGGTEHLKIGLENTSDTTAGRYSANVYVTDYLDGGITNGWQKVTIPLLAFGNLDTFSTATSLTFVFEKAYADQHPALARTGTVFIDEVRFSTVLPPVLLIDSFGDNWGWSSLGGNWGGMGSSSVGLSLTFNPAVYLSPSWSMLSTYNVPSGVWQGQFVLFGGGGNGWTAVPFNVSDYRYFKFSARARSSGENPVNFKIEIQSAGRQLNYYLSSPLTTAFKTYVIDLGAAPVSPNIDKTSVRQVNIVYENSIATNKIGAVYFDDFEFSTVP